jgi:hypothetical protein
MKFNRKRFLLRVLVSPFVLGLLIVTFTFSAIRRWLFFIIYGGEFINYKEGESSKTILDVYRLIEENIKKDQL